MSEQCVCVLPERGDALEIDMAPSRLPRITRFLAILSVLLAGVSASRSAFAQEVTQVLVAPSHPVLAGASVNIWLVFLNTSGQEITPIFPAKLEGRLRSETSEQAVSLELRNPAEAGQVAVPPGGYARREYLLSIPEGMEGPVALSARGIAANPVVFNTQKPSVVAAVPETSRPKPQAAPEESSEEFNPVDFFKEHISGYQPFYFIAGPESPNARFQISFKYQLLTNRGPFVEKVPALKGLHLAYTQTSVWDWSAPSAPFIDSSYKPEFFYGMDRVDGGRWGEGFRLDLQGGLQHESNGKTGSDSRSANTAYVEPTAVFGKEGGFQFTVKPRAWVYLGNLSDNPDIAKYLGYFGLRAIAGWEKGLQLSAIGRVGSSWNAGSLQLDATYPMFRLLAGNLALYFQVQYFYGYGETLLNYKERTSSIRFGFAIYR
jgi:phospholipase A1